MTAQPWELRLARLEGAYEQIDKRLGAVDQRLETLDRKIDIVREDLGRRIEDLGRRIDNMSWRTTTLILGTWITTMLTLFFHKV